MKRISGVVALAIGALLLIGVPGAAAETYRPNTTSDHAPNGCTPSDCTLREAVIAANDVIRFDVIVLQPGKVYKRSALAGTAENAALDGDLDVTDVLRIETPRFTGKGRHRHLAQLAVIDANDNERVIEASAALTVRRVVLRDGSEPGTGGGIYAYEPLTVTDSRLLSNHTDNYGGAIHFSTGTPSKRLLVARTLVKGNTAATQSGGLYLDGPGRVVDSKLIGNRAEGDSGAFHTHYDAVIIRTTVSGNRAATGYGGGVVNDGGTLQIRNSTISGNRLTDVSGQGGGLTGFYPTVVVNSTIAGNRTGGPGGGIYTSSALSLNAVTIVRNRADTGSNGNDGGGVFVGGSPADIDNSIIALNTVGGSSTNPDCFGNFSSGGANLIGHDSLGCTGLLEPPDLLGGALKLGKLGKHGGPTATVPLLRGSRAINRAQGDAPAKDQRGKRKRGQRDIGAFEYKGKN